MIQTNNKQIQKMYSSSLSERIHIFSETEQSLSKKITKQIEMSYYKHLKFVDSLDTLHWARVNITAPRDLEFTDDINDYVFLILEEIKDGKTIDKGVLAVYGVKEIHSKETTFKCPPENRRYLHRKAKYGVDDETNS